MFKNIFSTKNKKQKFDVNSEIHNIVESFSKAKPLYKELIQRTHPDKHPENIDLATELSSLLNENRFNYSKLIEISIRIDSELFN